MALIKCPECGKEVSDKAEKCINCGLPLHEISMNNVQQDTLSQNNGSNEKNSLSDSEYDQYRAEHIANRISSDISEIIYSAIGVIVVIIVFRYLM